MLAPVIFLIALMLALATALLENSFASSKIAGQTAVARYSEVAISAGVADFTAGLAAYVAAHGSHGPWPLTPSESYPRSLCDPATPLRECQFSYTISGTITAGASRGDSSADLNDAAHNVQTSAIDENRISAVVSTTVSARDGTVAGVRSRLVTYRVFEAPPYAIAAGVRDSSAGMGVIGTAPGDSGGRAPDPTATGGAADHDTRIHVQLTCSTVVANVVPFRNDQQAAGNDGLPWGNANGGAYELPCQTAAAEADAFADRSWANGNAATPGWTP